MIYTKTQLGQTGFQSRSVSLTPRQRSTFIMFDGKRTIGEVMDATAGLGVTPEDVSHLMSLGFLEPVTAKFQTAEAPHPNTNLGATPDIDRPSAPQSSSLDGLPTLNAQVHYLRAYPIATRLTANLGLRGFRLNLAVEAAGDLDKLKALAPRIKEAVGPEKFRELQSSLYD